MGELIDDMLALSRLTRHEMRRETVDLTALARGVVEELRRAHPERQVEVVVAEDVKAQGDRELLRAVMENLIGNAWKFTAKKPAPRIEFGFTEGEDGQRVVFVKDNGAGFPMEYAHKLFGVFQRLHAAVEFPGTGVGLATVQRVINRHGGRVWADSVPGQGATFYFTI
jgi:light-regulated signal transduction histidine kinase (bacteriophytochrome)